MRISLARFIATLIYMGVTTSGLTIFIVGLFVNNDILFIIGVGIFSGSVTLAAIIIVVIFLFNPGKFSDGVNREEYHSNINQENEFNINREEYHSNI